MESESEGEKITERLKKCSEDKHHKQGKAGKESQDGLQKPDKVSCDV